MTTWQSRADLSIKYKDKKTVASLVVIYVPAKSHKPTFYLILSMLLP